MVLRTELFGERDLQSVLVMFIMQLLFFKFIHLLIKIKIIVSSVIVIKCHKLVSIHCKYLTNIFFTYGGRIKRLLDKIKSEAGLNGKS